jgi:hypothetical protein
MDQMEVTAMTPRHERFIIAPTGCVFDAVPQQPNPETSANVWTYAAQHQRPDRCFDSHLFAGIG